MGIYSFVGTEHFIGTGLWPFASVFVAPILVLLLLLLRRIVAELRAGAMK